MVHDEAKFVVDRLNGQLASIGVVVQRATATTGMTAGKETVKEFNKLIREMTDGEP